ncbi:MAG: PASTA domain-containing protein [Candidatus Latescibacterota bacterium]
MRAPLRTALLGFGAALLAGVLFLGLLDLVVMPALVQVDRVRTPQVRGLTVRQARQRLQQVGLRATIRDSVYNESVPAGSVVDQDPVPNQRVKQGRRVRLEMSLGPRFYEVPAAVVGKSLREARLQLEANHLALGEVTYVSSTSMPEGAVTRMTPPAGSSLPRGGVVDLEISNGPPTLPKAVPRLTGLSIEVVEDTLRKYEMRLGEVASRIANGEPVGTVLEQSPAPGERALPLSRVHLVVSVQDTTAGMPGAAPEESVPQEYRE